MRKTSDDLSILLFETQTDWEAWLEENHATQPGVWMRLAKKGSGLKSVNYIEAVEAALCFGWIDGQAKGFDESSHIQRFTPRRPRSKWSKINRERAEALIATGRMRPAGMQAIEQAKQNGQWEAAYDPPSTAAPPSDFQAELDKDPEARAFFESLDSRNRFAILYRIQTAVKAETRARRIQKFILMLKNREKLYP